MGKNYTVLCHPKLCDEQLQGTFKTKKEKKNTVTEYKTLIIHFILIPLKVSFPAFLFHFIFPLRRTSHHRYFSLQQMDNHLVCIANHSFQDLYPQNPTTRSNLHTETSIKKAFDQFLRQFCIWFYTCFKTGKNFSDPAK